MRKFTKEELELLKEAEPYFNTCIKGNYKRATVLRLDKLVADLWDEATGEKTPRNFSCGVCSFKLYLKVGKKYFEDLVSVGDELEPKVVTNTKSTLNTVTKNKRATNKK